MEIVNNTESETQPKSLTQEDLILLQNICNKKIEERVRIISNNCKFIQKDLIEQLNSFRTESFLTLKLLGNDVTSDIQRLHYVLQQRQYQLQQVNTPISIECARKELALKRRNMQRQSAQRQARRVRTQQRKTRKATKTSD